MIRRTFLAAVSCAAALGAAACFTSSQPQGGYAAEPLDTEGQVRLRAANDFGCPRTEVSVRFVGAGGYRASGCGRSATYVCEGGRVGLRGRPVTCTREGEVAGERAGGGCRRHDDCPAGKFCDPTSHECASS